MEIKVNIFYYYFKYDSTDNTELRIYELEIMLFFFSAFVKTNMKRLYNIMINYYCSECRKSGASRNVL